MACILCGLLPVYKGRPPPAGVDVRRRKLTRCAEKSRSILSSITTAFLVFGAETFRKDGTKKNLSEYSEKYELSFLS